MSGGSSSSPEDTKSSKRPNWISSLSSKFSSQNHAPTPSSSPSNNKDTKASSHTPIQKPSTKEPSPSAIADGAEDTEEMEPYVPQQPKSGGFFSSAIRRLSSSSQPAAPGKAATQGTTCPRQVLNVDRERERCKVKELDQRKLRRVAFCVDVEVVGVSRYAESDDAAVDTATKAKDKKMQARSEGEALKHPELFQQKKEKLASSNEPVRQNSASSVDDILENEMLAAAQQQEKEAARQKRQEKKEKKRKEAEAATQSQETPLSPTSLDSSKEGEATPHAHDRPTTDPVRMYRRCCQLREAPVLKRISEQLGTMKGEVEKSGVVPCLDLNGSRMQLPDIVCLGDWLAIVPVKRLLLDNANFTDEGVRMILAGLLAAKPPDHSKRTRSRSSPTRAPVKPSRQSSGVVEKISLRMNTKITSEGWRHISLFLNLSRSLKAIDMSMTPFPSSQSSVMAQGAKEISEKPESNPGDIAHVLYASLSSRSKESHFEELILSDCGLNTYTISKIVDAVSGSSINRLGVAKNHLDHEAIQHVSRYVKSGSCKGLDLGGNDLRGTIEMLAQGFNSQSPMWALSVADCNLDPRSLAKLMPPLLDLPDFRFLDLSHNKDLFSIKPTALGTLRKYLPQLKMLRRLQFNDTSMLPEQAIAIAEIIPDIRNLNHVSFLENPELTKLASATDAAGQEDSCAYYASLMWAVRISKTLLAVDVDPPTHDTNEVIQALGKQILAYAFRNMDRYTSVEAISSPDPYSVIPDEIDPSKEVHVPDVIAHLTGHNDADAFQVPEDESTAPDQDYIVGGTGVVKALSYVLGQKSSDLRRPSTNVSGSVTPTHDPMDQEAGNAKARDLAKNMLASARKIRCRLQAAMRKEAQTQDELMIRMYTSPRTALNKHYTVIPDHTPPTISHQLTSHTGRLQFLDHTLQSMITRFESEYPDCAIGPPAISPLAYPFNNPPDTTRPKSADAAEPGPEAIDPTEDPQLSPSSSSPTRSRTSSDVSSSAPLARPFSIDVSQLASLAPNGEFPPPASRRTSTASLAARAQALEEGQMHRFGQKMRRDVLPPAGMDDHLHRTSIADPAEPQHLQALRQRLEELDGEEIKESVLNIGLEATVKKWGEEADRIERKNSVGVVAVDGRR